MNTPPIAFGKLIYAKYPTRLYPDLSRKNFTNIDGHFRETRHEIRAIKGMTDDVFMATSPVYIFVSTGKGENRLDPKVEKVLKAKGFTCIGNRGKHSGEVTGRRVGNKDCLLVGINSNKAELFKPREDLVVHISEVNPNLQLSIVADEGGTALAVNSPLFLGNRASELLAAGNGTSASAPEPWSVLTHRTRPRGGIRRKSGRGL